jgi:hypothetical protein
MDHADTTLLLFNPQQLLWYWSATGPKEPPFWSLVLLFTLACFRLSRSHMASRKAYRLSGVWVHHTNLPNSVEVVSKRMVLVSFQIQLLRLPCAAVEFRRVWLRRFWYYSHLCLNLY